MATFIPSPLALVLDPVDAHPSDLAMVWGDRTPVPLTIEVDVTGRGSYRPTYRYRFILGTCAADASIVLDRSDLNGGAGDEMSTRDGMRSLLGFLTAWGEAFDYCANVADGPFGESETLDLFPSKVAPMVYPYWHVISDVSHALEMDHGAWGDEDSDEMGEARRFLARTFGPAWERSHPSGD